MTRRWHHYWSLDGEKKSVIPDEHCRRFLYGPSSLAAVVCAHGAGRFLLEPVRSHPADGRELVPAMSDARTSASGTPTNSSRSNVRHKLHLGRLTILRSAVECLYATCGELHSKVSRKVWPEPFFAPLGYHCRCRIALGSMDPCMSVPDVLPDGLANLVSRGSLTESRLTSTVHFFFTIPYPSSSGVGLPRTFPPVHPALRAGWGGVGTVSKGVSRVLFFATLLTDLSLPRCAVGRYIVG